MYNSRPKTAYLLQVAISWLCLHYEQTYFGTFTFAENVTELSEAKKRWRPVRDYLARKGVVAVGSWERQKRGAWHVHVVISDRVEIEELRAFCMSRGWGSFINLRRVSTKPFGCEGWKQDVEKVSGYLCSYVAKNLGGAAWGESLSIYVGRDARRGNVKFCWGDGLSAVWRAGLAFYWDLHHRRPNFCKNPVTGEFPHSLHRYIMCLGLEMVLGRPGSEAVANHQYFYGDQLAPALEGNPF